MDPVGIKEINDNDSIEDEEERKKSDVHTRNVTDLELPSRLIAKIFLFRTIYRGSGWAFAHDPNFTHVSDSVKFWDEKNAKFYAKYKGLDAAHHDWVALVASRRPVIGPTGREWQFQLRSNRQGEMQVPWTEVANRPVQGSTADLMSLARISARNRIRKYKLADKALFVSTVHDDIKLDVPEDLIKPVANILYEVFDDIPKNAKNVFKWELPVKFPGEVKYGPNYKELKTLWRKDL